MLDKEKMQIADFLTELVDLAEKRGFFFREHAMKVTEWADAIAWEMGMPEEEKNTLSMAAKLHDIGDIAVSDLIYNKPGSLSDEEMGLVKIHPIMGGRLIIKLDSLRECAPLIRHHHERSDGKGYPDGLNEETLTLPMKILIVAEAYEAMTSERPYRGALSREEAIEQLLLNSGSQFSPPVVEALVRILNKGR
ncbi:MAG: HD domain-containing phosphohydrolase [bacterium]